VSWWNPGSDRPLRFSGRDWLQLFVFWLLGGAVSFLVAFLALQRLMEPALMQSLTERIIRQVELTEALLRFETARDLPKGVTVRETPRDALLPGSAPLTSRFDRSLQRNLRAQHGIERRLLRDEAPLQHVLGGYWVALAGRPADRSQIWLYVPSSFSSQPFFWPLVRSITFIGGALVGLLLFLQLRVELPLRRLLAALPEPSPHDDSLPLVPEQGLLTVRSLARGINQLIEQHNGRAASRRDLLRGLVHDLRSPLSRLVLRSQLLQQRSEPEDRRQILVGVESDLDQLAALADQLAALASQDDPGVGASCFSLDEICVRIAQSYPPGAVQLQVPRLLVRLNQEMLQRSLINLIDNGLEYGAAPVVIRAQARRSPRLELLVDDHGLGLPDYQAAASGLLPRSDDRQRSRHRGLGLAIVQRFCRDHGGTLRLLPAPCGGLRVSLTLPRALQLEI
jgi:two-component system osmolarity sensor histidine kinase EnvZ